MLKGVKNGGYNGNIIVKDCLVQGVNAPKSIKDAIESFNCEPNQVDLILITRGGGSLEDLMAFSSEKVVKAIFESNIFTISAIGHEVDCMLSDFTADLRAPTPSVGAQIILNEYNKKFLVFKDAEQVLSKIQFELKSRLDSIKNKFEPKDVLIQKVVNTRLRQILDEIRLRFKILKANAEKIKNRIESNDIIIINPETGNKVENSDELYNEFILQFNGERLLINPKSIIDLKN
jgi:exodeoxyribonuclease VII large subunit